MEQPLLLWNATHSTPITGIFIPMSGDEALNLQHAIQLRSMGMSQSTRTIVEVYHSYTAFEIALMDLDAKLNLVLRGTSEHDSSGKSDSDK